MNALVVELRMRCRSIAAPATVRHLLRHEAALAVCSRRVGSELLRDRPSKEVWPGDRCAVGDAARVCRACPRLAGGHLDRGQTAALRVSETGRRTYSRRINGVLFCLIWLVTVAIALGPTAGIASDNPAGFRLIVAAITLVGLAASYRTIRRAIIVDGARLIVRNILWTWSAQASGINWFVPPRRYGAMWRAGIQVSLANGRLRRADAFTATPADGGKSTGTPETTELNAWLLDVTQDRPPTPVRPRPLGPRAL